jgi:hypothetical protein
MLRFLSEIFLARYKFYKDLYLDVKAFDTAPNIYEFFGAQRVKTGAGSSEA